MVGSQFSGGAEGTSRPEISPPKERSERTLFQVALHFTFLWPPKTFLWPPKSCLTSYLLLEAAHSVCPQLIRTSFDAKYSGSMKITTHLDHISHGKIAPGTNWLNRWTYQVFIVNTRHDSIKSLAGQAGQRQWCAASLAVQPQP